MENQANFLQIIFQKSIFKYICDVCSYVQLYSSKRQVHRNTQSIAVQSERYLKCMNSSNNGNFSQFILLVT